LVVSLLVGVVFCSHLAGQAPQLETKGDAKAGYYTLQWKLPGADKADNPGPDYELVESGEAGFEHGRIIYRGADVATIISGKPDGTYHYRVRATVGKVPGDWSRPLTVHVAHHPLPHALVYLVVGALVFVATLAVIFWGHKQDEG
jgi:hypothetical protein